MAPPRLFRPPAEDGRCPAMLVRRDGEGAAIPLTRPLFSRLIALPPLDDPILGTIDFRALGILRRGGALLFSLLPLLTLAPPAGLLDDDIGGLA